jgi:hypothetical protein
MQGGGFDVSFTKDGNLFKTLASSYAGGEALFVNAVIANSYNNSDHIPLAFGSVYDTANSFDTPANSGHHDLSASDFNTTNGTVSWFGALAFAEYLNNIGYGGSHDWHLPYVNGTFKDGCNFAYSGQDCGYNVSTNTNEMAQLYFAELNKKSQFNTSGQSQSGYGIFGNNGIQVAGGEVGPFTNVQSSGYWSGTEYIPADGGWDFNFSDGNQDGSYKNLQFYAWAVTPGQVTAAVPEPGVMWLLGAGLLGWGGLKRRGHAG